MLDMNVYFASYNVWLIRHILFSMSSYYQLSHPIVWETAKNLSRLLTNRSSTAHYIFHIVHQISFYNFCFSSHIISCSSYLHFSFLIFVFEHLTSLFYCIFTRFLQLIHIFYFHHLFIIYKLSFIPWLINALIHIYPSQFSFFLYS